LTSVTESRRTALRICSKVGQGLRLDVAFGRAAPSIPARDRAFVHELTYGVSRLRGRLDHLVDRRVRGDPSRIEAPVREVLRLGAYQVLYMRGVPSYAAVSQAVTQARELAGRGAGGLVNAVLRGVGADGDGEDLFPGFADDPLSFLETWGSHPRWLLERWLQRWSAADVRALVEADNTRPSTYLVPLDMAPDQAVVRLAGTGIDSEAVGVGSCCVRLSEGTDPRAALAVLPSVIQDPGANLVTRYADVPEGTKVADLCAAPGGKALALSGRASYTLAADRSEGRMRLVRDNSRRTGRRIGMVVADATQPPLRQVDAVLLDVPCTGTGTLRRHPDGRWRLVPRSVDDMSALQRRMLDAAAELVPPGGLLIYSTCSLEPEENALQVSAFLRRWPGFRLDASEAVPAGFRDTLGQLQVLPQKAGFDGAFAARIRRAA
jgi:16S rRNA (cytosine967-C5)-methyltransferase